MDAPRCKNRTCPTQGTDRRETFVLQESDTSWTFCCRACKGIEVRTKPQGWKAAQQYRHEQGINAEYARKRTYFDLGRR